MEVLILVAFSVTMLVYGIGFGLTLIRDTLRPIVLSIDVVGFRDHRSGVTVAWQEVSTVQYHYGRGSIACLALMLRERIPPRQNPLRLGYRYRRRDQLIVPLVRSWLSAWISF